MDSLERDLEIFTREARKHEAEGRRFRGLAKKTQEKIKNRDAQAEQESEQPNE